MPVNPNRHDPSPWEVRTERFTSEMYLETTLLNTAKYWSCDFHPTFLTQDTLTPDTNTYWCGNYRDGAANGSDVQTTTGGSGTIYASTLVGVHQVSQYYKEVRVRGVKYTFHVSTPAAANVEEPLFMCVYDDNVYSDTYGSGTALDPALLRNWNHARLQPTGAVRLARIKGRADYEPISTATTQVQFRGGSATGKMTWNWNGFLAVKGDKDLWDKQWTETNSNPNTGWTNQQLIDVPDELNIVRLQIAPLRYEADFGHHATDDQHNRAIKLYVTAEYTVQFRGKIPMTDIEFLP